HTRAHAEMVVRNRPGEQKRPGVVPVVLSLDDFGAGRGHELTEIDLKALRLGWFEADVSLFQITKDGRGLFRAGDTVESAAKTKVNAESHRIGIVLERDFRHIQRKLVGLYIEIAEVIEA